MIIIGEQLRELAKQHNIISEVDYAFDGFSIELSLSNRIKRLKIPDGEHLVYGGGVPQKYIDDGSIEDHLLLKPAEPILACSREYVSMPLGYFGFIQTKGSLARHFVSVTCSDGQIDPGFKGAVTFEMSALGHAVQIPVSSKIARLFLIKCSTKFTPPYSGKYKGFDEPTHPLP